MNKRYIITGAPGTGKTSVLNALRKRGYLCYDEISRKVIIKQQQLGTHKTPWGDLSGFVDLVYEHTLIALQCPIESDAFVDRGVPDCIAYLREKSCEVPEYLFTFPFKQYYAATVFLTPPWEEIYSNDPQRLQSYQEAVRIHEQLIQVYQNLNFKIEILPKATVVERVDCILGFSF